MRSPSLPAATGDADAVGWWARLEQRPRREMRDGLRADELLALPEEVLGQLLAGRVYALANGAEPGAQDTILGHVSLLRLLDLAREARKRRARGAAT